jgi:hypothetical protein
MERTGVDCTPRRHRRAACRSREAAETVTDRQKSYAVGLEKTVSRRRLLLALKSPAPLRLAGSPTIGCEMAHNRGSVPKGSGSALKPHLPTKLSSLPLRRGGFFFCPCLVRRSAGSPSPVAGFEVRPISSARKIERPTAVHTVFGRPGE